MSSGPATRRPRTPAGVPDPAEPRNRVLRAAAHRAELHAEISFRGIPAAADAYAQRILELFAGMGKPFGLVESERLRANVRDVLNDSTAVSANARLVCAYSTLDDREIEYSVFIRVRSLADRYERYLREKKDAPRFGACPDARVMDVAAALREAAKVLDVGAGTGRNAVGLALRGNPVDAVEMVPAFRAELEEAVRKAGVAERVRLVSGDFFEDATRPALSPPYDLVVASEMVPHVEDDERLARFFRIAGGLLAEGGLLLINGFVAEEGFVPDSVVREASVLAWSTIFTRAEYEEAAASFELVDHCDAVGYERERWPKEHWPPTDWYEGWASAGDVFGSPGPAKLMWLLFRKSAGEPGHLEAELPDHAG